MAKLVDLLKQLIDNGDYFTCVFRIDGAATAGEIPHDLEKRFYPHMTIEFGAAGMVRDVVLEEDRLNFTAPFYSTLGRACYCSIRLERIVGLRVHGVEDVLPATEIVPVKDHKGLRSV